MPRRSRPPRLRLPTWTSTKKGWQGTGHVPQSYHADRSGGSPFSFSCAFYSFSYSLLYSVFPLGSVANASIHCTETDKKVCPRVYALVRGTGGGNECIT